MKIRVVIPFYSEYEATKPGLKELRACEDIEFSIQPIRGTYIAEARNAGVLDSFDYHLFIDSDIGFSLEDVFKLLKTGKEVIGGAYPRHENRERFCAGYWEGTGGILREYIKKATPEVIPVDFVGAGFLLVKSTFFEKKEPWFHHRMIMKAGEKKEIGEDFAFCILSKEKGIQPFCHFGVNLKHRRQQMNQEQQIHIPPDLNSYLVAFNETLMEMNTKYKALYNVTMEKEKQNVDLKKELEGLKPAQKPALTSAPATQGDKVLPSTGKTPQSAPVK